MKREELKKELQQMNVPSHYYNLDGTGRTDERYCLEFVNNEWQVYFSERGIKTTYKIFTSEDEACEYIFKQFYDSNKNMSRSIGKNLRVWIKFFQKIFE